MNDFLQSKFVDNLKEGKLPEVEVKLSIDNNTLLHLFAGAFLVALAVIIASNIFKKIGG